MTAAKIVARIAHWIPIRAVEVPTARAPSPVGRDIRGIRGVRTFTFAIVRFDVIAAVCGIRFHIGLLKQI